MPDYITISNLTLHLPLGLGPGASHSAFAVSPPPPCPISLTIRAQLHPHIVTADADSMPGLGVNYSSLSKDIYALVSAPREVAWDARDLLEQVAGRAARLEAVSGVRVGLRLERASLGADAVEYRYTTAAQGGRGKEEGEEEAGQRPPARPRLSMRIDNVRVSAIIGLHPHERRERQRLEVDIEAEPAPKFAKDVVDAAVESSYGTIESLAQNLATHLLKQVPGSLTLTIRKPSALPFAIPSITITRSSPSPTSSSSTPFSFPNTPTPRRVFIALGSNIEPRTAHLSRAVNLLASLLASSSSISPRIRTARMYESEPMYHLDQPRFLNSAIELHTSLEPLELLRLLKRVEREVGRVKTFENGPRVVDLDLIYYGDEVVRVGKKGDADKDGDGVGWLQVPHWGVGEREFALRPLCDIAPDFVDPESHRPLRAMLARLPQSITPVIPFPTPMPLSGGTMAIINATPDSFSDGSPTSYLDIPALLSRIDELFTQPFPPAMLDIGGMSTRPNSVPCTEQEELDRVVPLIRAIRSTRGPDLPISIDTYRPAVARAAVLAGASCINDVRGGREAGMLETMAELDVPVVLMHSRGDSSSMTGVDAQSYPGGVVRDVKREMGEMVVRALDAGVKLWNIVLDPGLGFAKSPEDSLTLLRHVGELGKLTDQGLGLGFGEGQDVPLLVGASRKGFVGKVVGRDVPAERAFGDAAVAAWCCGKVALLRVHDVRAAGEVWAMTKAIGAEKE